MQWVADQRKDYWRKKAGKSSFLDDNGFGMLTRRGFDWGQNPYAKNDDSCTKSKTPNTHDNGKTKLGQLERKRKPPPSNFDSGAKASHQLKAKISGAPSLKSPPFTSYGGISRSVATLKPPPPSPQTFEKASPKHTSLEFDARRAKNPPETWAVSNTAALVSPDQPSTTKNKSIARGAVRNVASETDDLSVVSSKKPYNVARSVASARSIYQANTENDETELDKKPAAKRSRKEMFDQTAKEACSKKQRCSNTATSVDHSKRHGNVVNTPNAAQALKKDEISNQTEPSTSTGKRGKRYCIVETPEFSGVRLLKKIKNSNLQRLVPHDQEQALFDEVIVEFADLLTCEEKLTYKKGRDCFTKFRSNITWERHFFEFLVFKKVFGHGNVPNKLHENEALGTWAARNRQKRLSFDPKLSNSRIERLEAAGFVWDAVGASDLKKIEKPIQVKTKNQSGSWESMLKRLKDYKAQFGDCLVPKDYKGDSVRIIAD